MAEETQSQNKDQDGQEKKPPLFEDLIEPDLLVRPWMQPFRPKDPVLRDFAMFIVTTLISGAISLLVIYFNEVVGVLLLGLSSGHFYYKYLHRRTKRAARKSEQE